MATGRPFAYNSGTTISGSTQYGHIAVVTDVVNYSQSNLNWYMGADEDITGYLIGSAYETGKRPQFWRSKLKTDASIIDLLSRNFHQSFTTGSDVFNWLSTNNYWTTYAPSFKIVGIPNAVNPVPYINTNLGTDVTGNTITAAYTSIGIRGLQIAMNLPNNMIAFYNTSSATVPMAFFSNNGGFTWSPIPGNNYQFNLGSTISDDGLGMFASRDYSPDAFVYSYNGGISWSATTAIANTNVIASNYNGSLVWFVSYLGLTAGYSNNNCASFTSYTQPFLSANGSMTSNGSRVWIGRYSATNVTDVLIAYTDNLGVSFTQKTIDTGVTHNFTDVRCSTDGKYLFAHPTSTTTGYTSSDFGATWKKVVLPGPSYLWSTSMSRSGKYVSYPDLSATNTYYLSQDYGNTWVTRSFTGLSSLIGTIAIAEI